MSKKCWTFCSVVFLKCPECFQQCLNQQKCKLTCFIWCQGVRKEVGVDEKCNQTFQHFHVCEHFCISESHQIDFNLQRWLFKGYVQSPLSSMLMESTEKFRSPQKIFGASQQNKHCSILLNYWSGSVQLSQGIARIPEALRCQIDLI